VPSSGSDQRAFRTDRIPRCRRGPAGCPLTRSAPAPAEPRVGLEHPSEIDRGSVRLRRVWGPHVWVVQADQPTERVHDLGLAGVRCYAEDGVGVRRLHSLSPPSRSLAVGRVRRPRPTADMSHSLATGCAGGERCRQESSTATPGSVGWSIACVPGAPGAGPPFPPCCPWTTARQLGGAGHSAATISSNSARSSSSSPHTRSRNASGSEGAAA